MVLESTFRPYRARLGSKFIVYYQMTCEHLTKKTRRRYKRLSDQEKQTVVDRYELGLATIEQLAEVFDVHRNTIGTVLRSRGAVKGCRAFETVTDMAAELDEKIRRRARVKWRDDIRRLDTFIAHCDMVGEFMKALMAADRDGRLVEFGRTLDTPRRPRRGMGSRNLAEDSPRPLTRSRRPSSRLSRNSLQN